MALFKYFSKSPASEVKKKTDQEYVQFLEGELVWAKLQDFPWWPGMICKHPRSKKVLDVANSEVHVQFFGDPPTRDWVLKKNVQTFRSRKPDDDKEAVSAHAEALEASKVLPKERLKQYYVAGHSDDEEEENNNQKSEDSESKKNSMRKGKRHLGNEDKKCRKRIKMSIASDNEEDDEGDDDSDDKDMSYEPTVNTESSTEEDLSSDDSDDSNAEKSPPRKKKITLSTPKVSKTLKVNNTPKAFVTPLGRNNTTLQESSFNTTPKSNKLNSSISRAQSALAQFSSPSQNPPPSPSVLNEDGQQYVHFTLNFLKDGNRRDKKGKLHTDPEYDGRTLLVPKEFLNSKEVTPGLKQWWQLKSDMYDTIIFFKVGKFYEFYHMDAVAGVKELGLLYMRGKFAHCGFPEVAFSRYSDVFVQRGYKVARVEQTETPQALSARGGGKVVRREVCAVITKGTRTYGVMEGHSDEGTLAYLLAFMERPCTDGKIGESVFGVCFVDTSIGKFYLGQFVDDRQCSRFLTMISQFPPAQVLFERNGISPKVKHILNHELLSTIKESLVPGSEFWNSSKTLKFIAEQNYFNDENKAGPVEWPPLLKEILKEGDPVSLEAPESFQHAVSALGACTWYLKRCCIEQELLSMAQFEEFIPSDNVTKKKTESTFSQTMILDGVTLTNLDVIRNTDGGLEGTLLELLDHCSTAFGKRYFTQWLCSPSCSKSLIDARLDAVEELMKNSAVMDEAKGVMKSIPDLARILRRIHTIGSFRRSQDHPESRAVYFNEEVYSKKKIADLLAAIEGFKKVLNVVQILQEILDACRSSVLKNLLTLNNNGTKTGFPDLKPALKFFEDAFDHKSAKETGNINPKPGVLEEYDTAMSDMDSIKEQLNTYLKQQKKRLGASNISYWGTGKNRYQLEVPESALRSSTPNDYHLKSQKKGFKRFYTQRVEELLESLTSAEERRDNALKDTMRNIFNKFDKEYSLWDRAVRCIATLDCLMSLAFYSQNLGSESCRPEIVDVVDADGNEIQPFIELRNCRHPCAGLTWKGDDFIPNDILLGVTEDTQQKAPCCILLTGPNMGGKSTLMRQAGVLLIMAQLGCYVPAEVCRFTPVDRVFTRLGARDRILHGESTFFVELSETSTIFQHATKHSLVLLDELGRGTSTYDGTAIASAVVQDLASRINCRTFFSTHYHSLVDDFSNDPNIRLAHMACMVEKDDEDCEDPTEETITFLYKFAHGACPKSYGFNAAKLAGLPISIIKKAHSKAIMFEESTRNLRQIRAILNENSEEVTKHLSLFSNH